MEDFFAAFDGKKPEPVAKSLRESDLPDGMVVCEVVSLAPVFVDKVGAHALRWELIVRHGEFDGKKLQASALMAGWRIDQVCGGLANIGCKGELVTDIVRDAMEVLPGQVVRFRKTSTTSPKTGKTYHDLHPVGIVSGESLPF